MNNNIHSKNNAFANSLFNFNDSYSWTNHECNCNNTLPETSINENIIILPPNAQTEKLVEINLPSSDIQGIEYNSAQPVVGIIKKPFNKAPISLANNTPNTASIQLVDALGSLTQQNLVGEKILPSNQELKVHSAISEITNEVASKLPVSEVRPEVQLEVRPEIRPEVQLEVRPEIRPEVQLEVRPEVRPEVQLEVRPEVRPEVQLEVRPEVGSESKIVTSSSAVNSAIVESANKISSEIASDSTITPSAVNEIVKEVIDEKLTKPITENASETTNSEVNSTTNNGTLATVQVKPQEPVAVAQVANAVSTGITNAVVENIAENFTQQEAYNAFQNLYKVIHSHIVEKFENATYRNVYNNSSYSARNIIDKINHNIEHMTETEALSNINSVSAEVVKQDNTNIITVETSTNSDLNKSATAEAVAAIVTKTLGSAGVSNVAVLTNPNNNSNNVIVSAEVPLNINAEKVANAIVQSVDRTARVVRENGNNRLDTMTTLMIGALVGFVVYNFYLKR